jgi:hypothetical protein
MFHVKPAKRDPPEHVRGRHTAAAPGSLLGDVYTTLVISQWPVFHVKLPQDGGWRCQCLQPCG